MMEKEVSVFVPVYNHRNYIKQTLDSILIQKVTFPYEIVIHDDASTDGTTEIIKEYDMTNNINILYEDVIRILFVVSIRWKINVVKDICLQHGIAILICVRGNTVRC